MLSYAQLQLADGVDGVSTQCQLRSELINLRLFLAVSLLQLGQLLTKFVVLVGQVFV